VPIRVRSGSVARGQCARMRRAEPVVDKPVLIILFLQTRPSGPYRVGVYDSPALRFAAYGDKYGFGPPGLYDDSRH